MIDDLGIKDAFASITGQALLQAVLVIVIASAASRAFTCWHLCLCFGC